MADWKAKHAEIEKKFLNYLCSETDNFILKGGTALYLCYGLTRFSEDIDLDGKNFNVKGKLEIRPYVENFCKQYKFSANLKKDTDTVERWMIDYGEKGHHLKVEVSYRGANNLKTDFKNISGIKVYSIDRLATMKATTLSDRTKIRDFYDICFIVNNHWDALNPSTQDMIRDVFEYKNFDYVEFLMETQKDELVNADELIDIFLDAYEKAGMTTSERDKKTIENIKEKDSCQERANSVIEAMDSLCRSKTEREDSENEGVSGGRP